MVSLVSILAWCQTQMESCVTLYNRLRRTYLVPLAHAGGRDMFLLKNGQWIDAAPATPEQHIVWSYNAERNELRHTAAPVDGRLARWPWLSVSNESHDLSDFFTGLRLSTGHTLTNDKAFMLYAHQKGHLPHGLVTIIKRDGSEEIIHTYEGSVPSLPIQRTASAEDINYVR
jgi:hypothetical protein